MEIVGVKLAVPPSNMNRCEEHGFTVDSFCRTHSEVCCKDCISSNHDNCTSVIPLKEAAKDGSFTDGIDTITKNLEVLMSKFDTARNSERETMRTVDSQGRELEKRVKKFRQNVNQMLDKLETSMTLKKDEICGEEKSVLKKRIDVCDTAITNIKDSLQTVKGIQKEPGTEKALVAMSKMKTMNEKYQGVLDELNEGRGEFTLKFIPNGDLVQALDSLGSINVKSTVKPTEVVNDTSQTKLVKTNEIHVASGLDTTSCTITGCAYLSDGTLVLADESNTSVKVVAKDSHEVGLVKVLEYAPWDVIAISENEVAVRSSFTKEKIDKKIHIFKIDDTIEETSSVNVDGRPRSIAYHDGKFYVTLIKKTDSYIAVYSTSGKVLKTIKPKQQVLFEPQYLTFEPTQGILYVSDFSRGIAAVSTNGDVIFQRVEDGFTEYGGITIGNLDDVFVCAGKPYGIYRLTKNGSSMEPFITWDTEVDPQALTFCHENNSFLVTCCNSGSALVYGHV